MKPSVKKLWVKALRSGKYKQAKGRLRKGDAFCCLGVLCDLHRKKHKRFHWRSGWYHGSCDILPAPVMKWAGLDRCDPPKIDGKHSAATLNDRGYSFSTIADYIEREL